MDSNTTNGKTLPQRLEGMCVPTHNFVLRPYQQRAVDDAMEFINRKGGRSAIIVQPTGAGKSLLIANIAKECGKPTLVLQPSKELLEQNYDKYLSYGGKASIYSASLGVKELGSVTFATPNSVKKEAQRLKDMGVKLVIVDECHYGSGGSQVIDSLCKAMGATKIIGLTATPVVLANGIFGAELRMMNRTRKSMYQSIIHITQIKDLSSNGYWTRLEYDPRKTDTSPLKLNTTGTDYQEESVRSYYDTNSLRTKIVEACDQLIDEGRKHILCFVSLVEEAKAVQQLMKTHSVVVYGDMPQSERNDAISKFKSGEAVVAVNVNVLGTGFDFPKIDACVHARPTGSIGVYYQHLGRLVRIHPEKDSAKIIDLSGNYYKFGELETLTFEHDIPNANGWCMKSKGKILTAFSLPDVVKDYTPKFKKENRSLDTYSMPFGLHKGKNLKDVPESYLKWIVSDKFDPSTTTATHLVYMANWQLNNKKSPA